MKKMATILLVLGSFSVFAVDPDTKLRDLEISEMAGNIFGASGFGGSKITFQKSINIKASTGEELVTVYKGTGCRIQSETFPENHTYDKGHGYGIHRIEIYLEKLRIFASNAYYTPTFLWIDCSALTEDSTVEELEKALGGVIKFK